LTRRYELLESKWIKFIGDQEILVTKKLQFNTQFVDTDVIKDWIEKGLPNDSFSI